jgi:hypothetical protein
MRTFNKQNDVIIVLLFIQYRKQVHVNEMKSNSEFLKSYKLLSISNRIQICLSENILAKIETIAKDEQKSAEVPSGESESADSKKELES